MAQLANLVKPISADEDTESNWDFWMEQSNNKLVVVDIHKTWCGPCEVMNPTFRRVFLELDSAESRLQFLTADSSQVSALAEHHENSSCKPLFKLYKGKQLIGTVNGANAPQLQSLILENIPEMEDED